MSENGRGAIDATDPYALPSFALWELRERADVILSIGSRFLSRGKQIETGRAKVVLVNLDPADLRGPRNAEVKVCAEATDVLAALVDGVERQQGWGAEIAEVRERCNEQLHETVAPQMEYINALRSAMPRDGVLVNELTQVGFASTYGFPVEAPNSYIWPGYQGTLGYGFPTALGAAVGAGGRPVVSVTGDGGFGWSLQELATARRLNLPVVVVLFEDSRFGNVFRIQRENYGSRFIGTDLTNPDFKRLSEAFGVNYLSARDPEAVRQSVTQAIESREPTLVKVRVDEFPSPWPLIHEIA